MNQLNLKIEQYEGPLDLLLALITRQKLDIFDIPIAQIADQYLAYINDMEQLDMEVTSEFIAMAAELMLIKSKLLLPRPEDEPDPRQPLVDALLEHRRATLAAAFLRERSGEFYDSFTRPPEEYKGEYLRRHELSLLHEAFARMYARTAEKPDKADEQLFQQIKHQRYFSVDEKVPILLRSLAKVGSLTFERIFDGVGSRSEMIATFLALLETMSRGQTGFKLENDEIRVFLVRTHQTSKEEIFA